jgi:orotidine-5'-phosphate decarboxylase
MGNTQRLSMTIVDKYNTRVEQTNSLLCVGLDTDVARIPDNFRNTKFPRFEFNRYIIEQTHTFVSAYKPNMAFYENNGASGWHELSLTIEYLRANYPDIVTICDAKRGDIENTNAQYAHAIFDELGFDAITVSPYMGKQSLEPFLERKDKAVIVLCRTSNDGAGEIQDLHIDGTPLWEFIATKVVQEWNTHNNCMLVMGATYPSEIQRVRRLVGEMTLLVPGIGTQGGQIEPIVVAGVNHLYKGLIINASRSVIYADNPAQEAQRFRDKINAHRGA